MHYDRIAPHDVLPEHRGIRHPVNASKGVEEILRLAKGDRHSRILAVAAMCCQCKRDENGVRRCDDRECALWSIRPFQCDTEPKGAPHVRHVDSVDGEIE